MKTKHFVRQSLFLASLLSVLLIDPEPRIHAEPLPVIDARSFDLTPLEISRSGRIYRFRVGGDPPNTGTIVLVESDRRPVMAFRVLKTNLVQREMIAKRVRRYDVEGTLEINRTYTGAEKVAERVITPLSNEEETAGTKSAPEPEQAQSQEEPAPVYDPNAPALLGDDGSGGPEPQVKNARSLESFDEELDSTTTPRNLKKQPGAENEIEEEADEAAPGRPAGPGIEEQESLIRHPHSIGLTVGSFRNISNLQVPGINSNGFTVYYSEVFDKGIWSKGPAPQDSLSIEGGIGYYSRANLTGVFDYYTVLPIRAEMLYTLQFNPTFAFLTHVGGQFNWVVSTDKATDAGLASLSGFQPNAGVGILYNIGPQWYLRVDGGLDRIGIGLVVKW